MGYALKEARAKLTEKAAPLIGLVAVFVFAAQMINFPVAAGTSGHLLGGALAAVLVGPYAASLAITVVLVVQALLFADGGLTAIGLNVFNMSIVGVWTGYGIFLLMRKFLGNKKSSVVIGSAVGAFISVPLAAASFSLEYAIGGEGTFSNATVFAAMFGTHILIGIGEGIITFLTISAILKTRPDLVYGMAEVQK
ncbi:MAG: cobalamin biosynthesis protein CbiM [Actinobacteria bacterium]|uniref:Cobalamin biosynthesis protein CbiM n=1 Tax=Candidatus Fonsibacter lacus TaxID=2576439 RepID=A0A965GC32_9PROT|nr:cobalamin biosynthesis protein CbiM [Candidatus Fonsibacter lacus]